MFFNIKRKRREVFYINKVFYNSLQTTTLYSIVYLYKYYSTFCSSTIIKYYPRSKVYLRSTGLNFELFSFIVKKKTISLYALVFTLT